MRQVWDLDSIGSALSEHWRKARESTVRLFWSTPVSWLEAQRLRPPVTTSPPAEDSSGTRPDPRRY
jgi:hypothetical protein